MLKTKKPYTILENNISQTTGSAGSGMAVAVGTSNLLPALNMLGYKFSISVLLCWGFSVAFLGVCFAVPLRRQMIIEEKLRFPTGFATAQLISAMYNSGKEALLKAKALIISALIAGLIVLIIYFFPVIAEIPIFNFIGLYGLTSLGFVIAINPMMFGAGMIIGFRVGLSLLFGAIISWLVIGNYLYSHGIISGSVHNYKTGLQGWLLWPGVALMIGDSLTALALSWRTVLRAFRFKISTTHIEQDFIPATWWLGGIGISAIASVLVLKYFFAVPWLITIFGILLSLVLAIIATRSLGETDINPVGAMGKVTQLVFGSQIITTNLMAAGVTAAGAASAGDMMQDLKTGYMLGASPKKQFIAQCLGVIVGIFGAVLAYKLFENVYDFKQSSLPMPAAHAWLVMAEFLSEGFSALPQNSFKAVFIALSAGIILQLAARIKKINKYLPSGMALGIAFILPAKFSLIMGLGALFYLFWGYIAYNSRKILAYSLASGFILGEGIMGIVKALLQMFFIS